MINLADWSTDDGSDEVWRTNDVYSARTEELKTCQQDIRDYIL